MFHNWLSKNFPSTFSKLWLADLFRIMVSHGSGGATKLLRPDDLPGMLRTIQCPSTATRRHVTKTTPMLASLNPTRLSLLTDQLFCPHSSCQLSHSTISVSSAVWASLYLWGHQHQCKISTVQKQDSLSGNTLEHFTASYCVAPISRAHPDDNYRTSLLFHQFEVPFSVYKCIQAWFH